MSMQVRVFSSYTVPSPGSDTGTKITTVTPRNTTVLSQLLHSSVLME